jgi:hypothetical protein
MIDSNLALDVFLLMATSCAAITNLYFTPAWFRVSRSLGVSKLLRMTGWSILSARFAVVLIMDGEIVISIASTIALLFLAAGELAVAMNPGKTLRL